MATDRQIEANRLNAQKSTGPRTPEGKARSSMNALKTGIHARSLVIFDETVEELEALIAEYYAECAPATPQERFQVDALIVCEWYARRYSRAETGITEELGGIPIDIEHKRTTVGDLTAWQDRSLERVGRRLEATRRAFHAANKEWERLRRNRLAVEAAAEPEPEPVPEPVVPPQPTQSEAPGHGIGFVPSPPASTPPPPALEVAAAPKTGFHACATDPRSTFPDTSVKRKSIIA